MYFLHWNGTQLDCSTVRALTFTSVLDGWLELWSVRLDAAVVRENDFIPPPIRLSTSPLSFLSFSSCSDDLSIRCLLNLFTSEAS